MARSSTRRGAPATTPGSPAAGGALMLDWSKHKILTTPKPCRICTDPAVMTDQHGDACHKVCAEKALGDTAQRVGRRG